MNFFCLGISIVFFLVFVVGLVHSISLRLYSPSELLCYEIKRSRIHYVLPLFVTSFSFLYTCSYIVYGLWLDPAEYADDPTTRRVLLGLSYWTSNLSAVFTVSGVAFASYQSLVQAYATAKISSLHRVESKLRIAVLSILIPIFILQFVLCESLCITTNDSSYHGYDYFFKNGVLILHLVVWIPSVLNFYCTVKQSDENMRLMQATSASPLSNSTQSASSSARDSMKATATATPSGSHVSGTLSIPLSTPAPPSRSASAMSKISWFFTFMAGITMLFVLLVVVYTLSGLSYMSSPTECYVPDAPDSYSLVSLLLVPAVSIVICFFALHRLRNPLYCCPSLCAHSTTVFDRKPSDCSEHFASGNKLAPAAAVADGVGSVPPLSRKSTNHRSLNNSNNMPVAFAGGQPSLSSAPSSPSAADTIVVSPSASTVIVLPVPCLNVSSSASSASSCTAPSSAPCLAL